MVPVGRRLARLARCFSSSTETRKLALSRKDHQFVEDPSFLPNTDIYVDQLKRGHIIADKLIVRRPDMVPSKADQWGRTTTSPLFSIGHPGGVREYVFNRERSGNLLDLQAVRWLDSRVWMVWRLSEINALIIRGSGDSLFSRGMPLSLPVVGGAVPNPLAITLLQELYQLVYLCSRTHKIIGIFNGRCTGNSAALVVHSPYRFATPSSVFSLPQTSQGYFPDAGLTHFLSRLENKVGFYLALTGAPLTGPDLMHAGIANFYMAADGREDLLDHMACNDGFHASVREYVSMVNDDSWLQEAFSLGPHLAAIERCFSQPTINTIMDALQAEHSSWGDTALDYLLKKCPLSLKVTLNALQQGLSLPLEEALKSDFRVGRALMSTPEFLGGVKAYLAKDNAHKWPRTLRDVHERDVRAVFDPDATRPDLKLPFEDYHDPYEIDWSLEARKRSKKSDEARGVTPHLPNILDDIERS